MNRSTHHGLLAAAMLAAVATTHAQSGSRPGTADPLDARAAVPAVTYVSPFIGYRPDGVIKVAPWKEANDTVARIGGWRAYAREASQPAPAGPVPAPAPAEAASRPAPGRGQR